MSKTTGASDDDGVELDARRLERLGIAPRRPRPARRVAEAGGTELRLDVGRAQSRCSGSTTCISCPSAATCSRSRLRNGAVGSPRSAGSRRRTCRSSGAAHALRQRRTSSTSCSIRSRSSIRSSCCDVISSERRPSETNWMPTTTSSTPSVRSGRCPMPCAPEPDHREVGQDDEADRAHEQRRRRRTGAAADGGSGP